ncbi:MAG: hypothetical protein K2L74_08360 [Muribaculaceae bacterium]|nr:hypothetical protein [Muribaculaceae bacterium]
MKKILLHAIALALPATALAQSATEAYTLSQSEIRGTARFMAMGGAFTALGGDLSAVSLNPASLGVYRSSEIGATLDISFRNYKTDSENPSQTRAYCNNFGYVGVARLGDYNTLRTFAWGAAYNRINSFDRMVYGYNPVTSTSLTNYVAAYMNGVNPADMDFTKEYNPYADSDIDWLGILSYSAYMINPAGNSSTYSGLFQNGTRGDAYLKTRERGYIDEYDLSFGGNISDVVMWGLNVGITDLSYSRESLYSESMEGAYIANYKGQLTTGNAGFDLYTPEHISGNGWNLNFGLIIKPVNELRIGMSIKTPTWWNLSHAYYGEVNSRYFDPSLPESTDKDRPNPLMLNEYTDDAQFDSRLRSPWKLNLGIAGVIGSKAIVSLDYEYTAYPSMQVKYQDYNGYYYTSNFVEDKYVTEDIKNYYEAGHSLRVGAEYRVTPSFSVRAGYAWQGGGVKSDVCEGDGYTQVYTYGTDRSYVFNKSTNYVSLGLGYRYKGWYIDAAYVHRDRKSVYHCYTDWDGNRAPQGSLSNRDNSIVLSTGFRF